MRHLIIYLGLILMFSSAAESHLNLYLNEHETLKLLGKSLFDSLILNLHIYRDGLIS